MLETQVKSYKTCPKWLKDKYREAVNYTCQRCNKHESEVGKLQPHRIKQGNNGGNYTVAKLNSKENNIKVLCNSCHTLIHINNYAWVKSR